MQHRHTSTGRGEAHAEHAAAPHGPFNFRRKAIASAVSVVLGASLLAAGPGYAADEASVSELQAENARLKQELQALKDSLQGKPAAQEGQTAESAPAAAEPEKKVAEIKESDTLDAVVVTSRNREEIAQDVPIPVRVIGGERLDREDVKTIWDLQAKAPNLKLNNDGENARKVSPGIRGLGRGGANDSMEQSVGIIVDGVTLYYSGQAWSDYVDLDRMEVLYGPQGTLMGKNTSLGAINIVTKAPSFTPSSKYELTVGDLNTLQAKFSSTGPIIDDKLAFRGTFVADRKDGIYDNDYLNFGKSKETWREVNKLAGRIQLLWTPTENLTGRFIADKLRSDERVNTGSVLNSNGPQFDAAGVDRSTGFSILGGYTPTNNNYARYGYLGKFAARSAWFHNDDGSVYQPKLGTTHIENSEARPQITNQHGYSAQFDWHVADHTLTSITAYRYQDFDIKNGGQFGQFYVSNSGQQLWNDQVSQEFRLASDTGDDKKLDYQLGLYYLAAQVYSDDPSYYGPDAGAWNATDAQYSNLIATAAGREMMRAALDGVYQSSVTDARVHSFALYGQSDWHVTEKATLTTGLRSTWEKKTNRFRQELDRSGENLAALQTTLGATAANFNNATAIRNRQLINARDWVKGEAIDDNLIAWNISPSYKINDDVMVYASAAQGVKSGFIYFNANATSDVLTVTNIKPEKSLDFEVGVKSVLLGKKLQLNANLYRTEVEDYQASWTRTDPLDNTKTVSGWGNAPKVLARGIELDANYRYNSRLDFNFAGAYNKATYEDEWLVQVPEVLSTTSYFDAKGNQVAGIPKVTLSYGFNYQFPVGNFLGRLTVQNTFYSGAYLNDNRADFTYQDSYNVTNLGLGIGARNKKWELALLGKNIFDTEYATSLSTYTSTAGQTSTVGAPEYWSLVFKHNL